MEPDKNIVFMGQRHEWGNQRPFGLHLPDRKQHLYIIGQTGTGKSTLLRNLILQDIEAGRGVALLDPHGDLAREVLDGIPAWRTDDVIYFDPTSDDPMSINLFRATSDDWHLVASGIVSSFKKIWGDSWGPRLEYILYATVAALAQCDNTSLLGVSRMLFDSRYREWVLKQVKDPMVVSFWRDEFEEYERRFRTEIVSPVQNKVGQLFLAPALRNVLGQVGCKVNFRFMMDNRRIFIANLSKGLIGEAHSALLGSLLVTGFELAALSRADAPVESRESFFLYADEFQHYATDSFASILSESRKYGLCLTLAHQYLGQLPESVRDAVFGNVGNIVAFRVSESDGNLLERQMGKGYTASQFTALPNYELCAKFLQQDAFMGSSFPPVAAISGRRDAVARRSREKYNAKRHVVERRIKKWLTKRF